MNPKFFTHPTIPLQLKKHKYVTGNMMVADSSLTQHISTFHRHVSKDKVAREERVKGKLALASFFGAVSPKKLMGKLTTSLGSFLAGPSNTSSTCTPNDFNNELGDLDFEDDDEIQWLPSMPPVSKLKPPTKSSNLNSADKIILTSFSVPLPLPKPPCFFFPELPPAGSTRSKQPSKSVQLPLEADSNSSDDDEVSDGSTSDSDSEEEVEDYSQEERELGEGADMKPDEFDESGTTPLIPLTAAETEARENQDELLDAFAINHTTAGKSKPTLGELNLAVAEITSLLKQNTSSTRLGFLNPLQVSNLTDIAEFFRLVVKGAGNRTQISEQLGRAKTRGDGVHRGRRICFLASYYLREKGLPSELRGGYRAGSCMLVDYQEVMVAAKVWLYAQKLGEVNPTRFREEINSHILPSRLDLFRPICEKTAVRWLYRCGFRRAFTKKGVFVDGHDKEEVKRYRQDEYLPRMSEYRRRAATFVGPELTRVEPTLVGDEKEVYPLFHDESCIHAGEYKKHNWLGEGQQILPSKGEGRLMHVSDFVCASTDSGRLVKKDSAGNVLEDSRVIIYPGAGGDNWWVMENLLAQLKNTIRLFEELHPNAQALVVFDCSSAHESMGHGALNAYNCNRYDGGKKPVMRDTVYPPNSPAKEKIGEPHVLWSPLLDDQGNVVLDPLGQPVKVQKGMETILRERGFKQADLDKVARGRCSTKHDLDQDVDCCLARLLARQEDFANQKGVLQEFLESRGHYCEFLPKFHCELNPIEMYWGAVKFFYRQTRKPSFAAAKVDWEVALDSVPVEVIRRLINRAIRFEEAYRQGLTGTAAAWAVRAQSCHRKASESAMRALDESATRGTSTDSADAHLLAPKDFSDQQLHQLEQLDGSISLSTSLPLPPSSSSSSLPLSCPSPAPAHLPTSSATLITTFPRPITPPALNAPKPLDFRTVPRTSVVVVPKAAKKPKPILSEEETLAAETLKKATAAARKAKAAAAKAKKDLVKAQKEVVTASLPLNQSLSPTLPPPSSSPTSIATSPVPPPSSPIPYGPAIDFPSSLVVVAGLVSPPLPSLLSAATQPSKWSFDFNDPTLPLPLPFNNIKVISYSSSAGGFDVGLSKIVIQREQWERVQIFENSISAWGGAELVEWGISQWGHLLGPFPHLSHPLQDRVMTVWPWFYQKMTGADEHGYSSLKRLDIAGAVEGNLRFSSLFDFDFVVLPICEDAHWFALVVCGHRSLISKDGAFVNGITPGIIILNSTPSVRKKAVENVRKLLAYMAKERKTKGVDVSDISGRLKEFRVVKAS
ncbi:hypothetical protein BDY24DRAFT_389299, partial [Mrakia frigida]|uniref:uncharacterized protein n=1 Tax=Mrakia frigida TaxID=29902 RepID=UPI003FCC0ED9